MDTILASVVMALACMATLNMFPEHHGELSLRAARLFVPLLVAVATFLVTAYVLRSEELRYLYDELIRKVRT